MGFFPLRLKDKSRVNRGRIENTQQTRMADSKSTFLWVNSHKAMETVTVMAVNSFTHSAFPFFRLKASHLMPKATMERSTRYKPLSPKTRPEAKRPANMGNRLSLHPHIKANPKGYTPLFASASDSKKENPPQKTEVIDFFALLSLILSISIYKPSFLPFKCWHYNTAAIKGLSKGEVGFGVFYCCFDGGGKKGLKSL
jgi:hypothetical protein